MKYKSAVPVFEVAIVTGGSRQDQIIVINRLKHQQISHLKVL